MTSTEWSQILERKVQALSKANITLPQNTRDYDTFQAYVTQLHSDFASKRVAKFVNERLAPHLDHVRSFTHAINSATQSVDYAPFIWAGLQAVIECACRFAEYVEETFRLLEQLHSLLPHFQEYVDLYKDEDALRKALGIIFEDYVDFCIQMIKYFSRGVSRNLMRNLFTSSSKKKLKRITDNIADHKQQFEAKATLISRRKTVHDHAEILAKVNPILPKPNPVVYPIFDIPYRRNIKFFGRDDVFKLLHTQLEDSRNAAEPSSTVLHGMGGIGKTQTAIEYTYRFRSLYDCVFWLPAEDSVSLSRAYCSIGRQVGLFIASDKSQSSQKELEAVFQWLKTTDKRWLLILDNVEDWKSISVYWPTFCVCRASIIVTSQKPADLLPWANCEIAIRHFDQQSGSSFLFSHLGKEKADKAEEHDAEEISKLVDGLPLFLTHISGHITQTQSSLKEYLNVFQASSSIWRGRHGGSNWMYERTVDTVFDVALAKLSTGALHLLYVMAFLNPDGVAEKILFPDDVDQRPAYLSCNDEHTFLEIVADLRDRQLVKRERSGEKAMLTIHRSVQLGILNKLDQQFEERYAAFDCALRAIRRVVPRPSILIQAEPEKWSQMEPHLPQLLSLRRAFARSHPRISGTFEFAQVLFDVGMNMWDRGLTRECREVLATAEDVLDAIDYPAIATIRANIHLILALILDETGISGRADAIVRRKKALDIRQALWDNKSAQDRTAEDEILLFGAIGDLCGSYRQINQFDVVRSFCKRLYEKYIEWGDIDTIPYEFAKYYNDMSFERAYCKDTSRAAEYARRAWTLMAKGDPDALYSNQYKLTWTIRLYQDGQHELAIKECLDIFRFRAELIGMNNYLTIQSHLTLGIMYFRSKAYPEAESCFRQILEPNARTSLSEESITRAQYYLSQVLQHSKKDSPEELEELRSLAQRGLERLLPFGPPELDRQTLEDPVLYDYLVTAGLRFSIVHGDEEGDERQFPRFTHFLQKKHLHLHKSRSLRSLVPRNAVLKGQSSSQESVARTLPENTAGD